MDRVDLWVVLAGGLDPGLQLAGNHARRNTAEALKGFDVGDAPVRYLLTCDRHGIDFGTGPHDRYKEFGLDNFSGLPVNIRRTVAGEIDEQLVPGLVVKSHDEVKGFGMRVVQLTEPAAAIAVGVDGAILFPQQSQCHPFLLHLTVKITKVRKRLAGRRGDVAP
jgi:hypothetical protein